MEVRPEHHALCVAGSPAVGHFEHAQVQSSTLVRQETERVWLMRVLRLPVRLPEK